MSGVFQKFFGAFIALLFGQFALIWLTTQNYTPGLSQGVVYLNILIYIVLWLGFLYLLWRSFQRRKPSGLWPKVLYGISALGLSLWLIASGLFSTIATGGFFGGVWVQTYRHPQLELTLYVYDHSFLDPLSGLWLKHSFLPLRREPVYLSCPTQELVISSVPTGFEIVAPTRTLFVGAAGHFEDRPPHSERSPAVSSAPPQR